MPLELHLATAKVAVTSCRMQRIAWFAWPNTMLPHHSKR
jgi:hypothetical protein